MRTSYNQDNQIEIKFSKKSIKKLLISILLIIIFIVIIIFLRKFYLINKVMKNVEKNFEITNYRVHKIFLGLDTASAFYTNGKVIVYGKNTPGNDNISNNIYYMNKEDNHVAYIVDTVNKTYKEEQGVPYTYQHQLTDEIYEEMSLKDKLIASITWKIDSEKVNGEECYHIRKDIDKVSPGNEYEFWISKKNYCKVKTTVKEDGLQGEPEKTIYYSTEIGTVSDNDVSFERLFPEFSNYKKIE